MRYLRPRRQNQLAGLVLIAGAVAFILIELVAEASYAGFDPAIQPLSRLGNLTAPTRWLWATGLLALAASWLVAAVALASVLRSRRLLALNVAPAVGLVVAVAVPLDANLAIHEVAAFSAFVLGILAMLADGARLRRPWRLGTAACAGLALGALSPLASLLVGMVGWGTLERLVVLPMIGGLVTFGLAMLVDADAVSPLPPTRRQSAILIVALVLALAGVGTGLTAGGTDVVAGELERHLPGPPAKIELLPFR